MCNVLTNEKWSGYEEIKKVQKRKILKSVEIISMSGILGLCGYLILSQDHSKEIYETSNNAMQVKMKENNTKDNITEEIITRDNMIITTIRNNRIDKKIGDVVDSVHHSL